MRPHSRTRPRGENGSFWTSYSDMMAGLMLVFALVMFFSIFQFLELQETKAKELAEKEEQLVQQSTTLEEQATALADKEGQLQISLDDLAAAQLLLTQQEDLLEQSATQLSTKQQEYDEQNQLLIDAQASLALQQQQLTEQEEQLTSQRDLMDAQQVKIDNLVGLRARIIQDLNEELRKANLDVSVDRQTGAITLRGAVLFDTGSDLLKESGMQLLNDFIPVYVRTLLAPENREYVGEIIIEGHADTDGDYLSNLDLSQRRALAVSKYCLSGEFTGLNSQEQEMLRQIMTANGRSWSNPIYYENGGVNKEASRRVEFKFRMKDAEMIDEMSQILENIP